MGIYEEEPELSGLALRIASSLVDDLKRQHDVFRSVFYSLLSLLVADLLLVMLLSTLPNMLLMVIAVVVLLLIFSVDGYTSSGTVLLSSIPLDKKSDVCEELKSSFESFKAFKCCECGVLEERANNGIYKGIRIECMHSAPRVTVTISTAQQVGGTFTVMTITIKSNPIFCFKAEAEGLLGKIRNWGSRRKLIEISIWHELKENTFLALERILENLNKQGIRVHLSVTN